MIKRKVNAVPESNKSLPEEFSRSKRKKEMDALQDVGKELIRLSESQLAKMIDLPDILLNAIHLAHTLKSHEAKRRHLQYIGKIMREIDAEPIRRALAQIKLANAKNQINFMR
jgi:ribosome-associated protein